jgi:signal transduction histidine kinase
MGETDRRSGLANLRRRAERHGGRMEIGPSGANDPNPHGTLVEWVIPLAANR